MECKYEYIVNGTTKFGSENKLQVNDIIDIEDNSGNFNHLHRVEEIKEVNNNVILITKEYNPVRKINRLYSHYELDIKL